MLVSPELSVMSVNPVGLVLKVHLEKTARPEIPDGTETMDHPARKAGSAILDTQATREPKDKRVKSATMALPVLVEPTVFQAFPDPRVMLVALAVLAVRVTQAIPKSPPKVQWDAQALEETRVKRA